MAMICSSHAKAVPGSPDRGSSALPDLLTPGFGLGSLVSPGVVSDPLWAGGGLLFHLWQVEE